MEMSKLMPVLLPFAIFIPILWLVAQGIKRSANKYPPVALGESSVSGVGGWLLLLIFLFFLLPLRDLASIYDTFKTVELQYPVLTQNPDYNTYKTLAWGSFFVATCLSVYAGVGLASGRNTKVVKRAIVTLWIIGPIAGLFMEAILPVFAFGKSEIDPQALGRITASTVGAAIWTAYLYKSKRVRATYGN